MTDWDNYYMNKPIDLPEPTEPLSDVELESVLTRVLWAITIAVLAFGAALAYAVGVL